MTFAAATRCMAPQAIDASRLRRTGGTPVPPNFVFPTFSNFCTQVNFASGS
jgi:hypothetical protein